MINRSKNAVGKATLENKFVNKQASTLLGKAGRPLGFDREQAINQAMNLFWENGVTSISSVLLADAMGIQRSSFYNTFGNKDSVFKEALDLYALYSPDRWLGVIKPGDPVLPQLKGYFKELCKVRAADSLHRGCLLCNSLTELAGKDSGLGVLLAKALKERIALLKSLMEQAGLQKEILANTNTADVATSLVAFSLGLNTLSKVEYSEQRLWASCEAYLDGLFRMIRVVTHIDKNVGKATAQSKLVQSPPGKAELVKKQRSQLSFFEQSEGKP